MGNPKFNEGAWVKKKDGTKGMTVIRYAQADGNTEFAGKVICKYTDEEGHDVEGEFEESELVLL